MCRYRPKTAHPERRGHKSPPKTKRRLGNDSDKPREADKSKEQKEEADKLMTDIKRLKMDVKELHIIPLEN